MNDHQLIVAKAARALGKVSMRLIDAEQRYRQNGTIAHLDPPSTWLADAPTNLALSGALTRVHRAQQRLLAMIDGTWPLDAFKACVAVQDIAGRVSASWSRPAQRMGKALGVELPQSPQHAPSGLERRVQRPEAPR